MRNSTETIGNAIARSPFDGIAKNIAENGISKKPIIFLLATITGLAALYIRQPETLLSGLTTVAFTTGAAWAISEGVHYIAGKISKLNAPVISNAVTGLLSPHEQTSERTGPFFQDLIPINSNDSNGIFSEKQPTVVENSSLDGLNISKDLGQFTKLPLEILNLIFNFIKHEYFTNTLTACKTFAAFTIKILNSDKIRPFKIDKFFKAYHEQLKIEVSPFPRTFKGNHNPFMLGPCLKKGGVILVQKGNEEKPPHGYLKEENVNSLQNIGNLNQWTMLSKIRDKELCEGDSHYSFFINDGYDCDCAKLSVIDLFNGDCVWDIDPFEDLSQTELEPPYDADDPRFLINFPEYNGSQKLPNFNEGSGKEIIGAHSLAEGNKILTVTKSGMVRQWNVDRVHGSISPAGSPLKIFEAYAGSCYTDVEGSWLTGNSLFVEVFTNDHWFFSKGKASGKKTLLQYDIRNNKLINQLELTSCCHIAVNKNTLFVASFNKLAYHPFPLQAYRIDPETLNLNPTWIYSSADSCRMFNFTSLTVNDKWVMFVSEFPDEIIILDANSGKVSATIQTSCSALKHLDAHLFDDLIVYRDTEEGHNKIVISHVLRRPIASENIPINESKQVDQSNHNVKFKFDFKNMKIYGLISNGSKQSLIEISKGDKKTS